MGAIGDIFKTISPVVSAVAGIISIITGLTQKVPKIHLPAYRIPDEDLEMLKRQIAGNIALSDEARRIAIEALENYRQGRLTPALEDLYNRWYKEQEQALRAELARRGFTEGSTQYRLAMQRLQEEAGAFRARLLEQQLNDALRASGLSDVAISDLLSKWQIESGIVGKEALRRATEQQLRLATQQAQAERFREIGKALTELGSVFEKGKIEEKYGKPTGERKREETEIDLGEYLGTPKLGEF